MRNVLTILSLILLLACGSEEKEEVSYPIPALDSTVMAESYGVTYVFSDSARVTANLSSGRVREIEEGPDDKNKENIHYLDGGVEIHILNAAGQISSRILSNEGIYRRKKGEAELIKDVFLTNQKGEKLNTQHLFWNEKSDSVYTDSAVVIETPDKIIKGRNGLRATSDFSSYTVIGIEGEMETDEDF